ncbi:MAG: Trm112 family protein [Salinarimonas sp.]
MSESQSNSEPEDESRGNAPAAPFGIDPKLLEILVCPLTKATLEYDANKQELISKQARLAYPIRDGIPIMLPEEARQLPD